MLKDGSSNTCKTFKVLAVNCNSRHQRETNNFLSYTTKRKRKKRKRGEKKSEMHCKFSMCELAIIMIINCIQLLVRS